MVKYLLNILALFTVLMVSVPQQASAACCSSEETCHVDTEKAKDQHDKPCGSSTCDCICCGSISLVLLKKDLPEVEVQKTFHSILFTYTSLKGNLFHSIIWQPPRL